MLADKNDHIMARNLIFNQFLDELKDYRKKRRLIYHKPMMKSKKVIGDPLIIGLIF
jgi:hypothetical protein